MVYLAVLVAGMLGKDWSLAKAQRTQRKIDSFQ